MGNVLRCNAIVLNVAQCLGQFAQSISCESLGLSARCLIERRNMLLAVDIGNTQTAIGLFDGLVMAAHWVFTTRAVDTADEMHLNLAGQFELAGVLLENVEDVVIASVVPSLTQCWATVARRITTRRPIVVGPGVKSGLSMHYDNPAEIGADRVADAVAAIDLEGAPVAVVDLGTATNIEVIDRDGRFDGGIIAPGMGTGAAALFEHAACLPQVNLARPDKVVGSNTNDAIRSGLIYGEVARVDGLVDQVIDELGYEMPVIATGGFSALIADISATITRCEPLLTLHG